MLKKSQISLEFLFTAAIIILVFLAVIIFVVKKNEQIIDSRIYLNQQQECFRFSDIITAVYVNGHGTMAELRTDYYITVYPENIIYIDNNALCSYLGKSQFYNLTGNLRIRNQNNEVIIENV